MSGCGNAIFESDRGSERQGSLESADVLALQASRFMAICYLRRGRSCIEWTIRGQHFPLWVLPYMATDSPVRTSAIEQIVRRVESASSVFSATDARRLTLPQIATDRLGRGAAPEPMIPNVFYLAKNGRPASRIFRTVSDGWWPKAATPYAGRSIHRPSPILSCGWVRFGRGSLVFRRQAA